MQIRDTLTKFNLDVSKTHESSITITSIVSCCNNLTDLLFSSKYIDFELMVGELSPQFQHQSLVNLEISSYNVTGRSIEPIIQPCQQLRRLVLDSCDSSVLETLVRNSTLNLELFSYNNGINDRPLPMLEETKTTRYQDRRQQRRQEGLRIIYASYGESSVQPKDLLPLIYKN